MKIAIVGRGKVGRSLAREARRAGIEVTLVRGSAPPRSRRPRSEGSLAADLIVLAVPDHAVAEVGLRFAERSGGSPLVHCAGSLGKDALAAARAAGASVGAMHPLVSFADARHAPSTKGALFLIDGDRQAVARASKLAKTLGARPLVAAAHGPAYHAAAALAANGSAALAFHAVAILEGVGLERGVAAHGVAALLESVASNVRRLGVPDALTGPIARGDVDTVQAHRKAIAHDRSSADAYDQALEVIVGCATAAGLPARRAEAIRAAAHFRWRDVRAPSRLRGKRVRSRPAR